MDNQLIMLTSSRHELGPADFDGDFEVGSSDVASNSLSFTGDFPAGCAGLYVPGTEFGGLFEFVKEASDDDQTVAYKAWTWRGLLSQWIICPPSGQDYYTVTNQDANTVIRNLLSTILGGFFNVPASASSITISSYTFALYTTVLDGLMAMLDSVDAKLYIHADKTAAGAPIQVTVEAVPAVTLDTVYNTDSQLTLTYTDDNMGINHLICMGSGKLQDRMRVDLYTNARGVISQTKTFTGFRERQAYFDYSSAQSEEDLIKYGTKRLNELKSYKNMQANDAELEGDIGDRLYGYFHGTGVTVPIARKTLKISGGMYTYVYKLKGEK